MPVSTPHFDLQAFVRGDYYSASVDKRRFTIIDNHLAFLSDRVGPGIINGWDLSDVGSLTLRCGEGIGIIDRFITRTFGYYERSLEDNNTVYAWMRRRPNIIGSLSSFSNFATFSYTDASSPAIPDGLVVDGVTTETISLSWTENAENDIDIYEVYQSLDGVDFVKVSETENLYYTVIDLQDETEYYFKIKAIDRSGNSSGFSSVISAETDLDVSKPGDPTNLRVYNNDEIIQILWRHSAVGEIALYRAYISAVDAEGFSFGPTTIKEVEGSLRYMQIRDVSNGQRYSIILKSVGNNEVESQGVTVYGRPQSFIGPRDVESVTVTDISGSTVISNVNLIISWEPYIDPYDINPEVSFEIKLEELQENVFIESEWIEVPDDLSRHIQVYPYNNGKSIEYRPIKERTLYYITVRSIDADGIRSPGIVAIYSTRDFVAPESPVLFQAIQQTDQTILVSWQNSPNDLFKNLFTFVIKDVDTEIETTIENETDIGISEKYIVSTEYIAPNTEYIFRIVSVDEFDNRSYEQETRYIIPDLDQLPRPPVPSRQTAQAGDRSVFLTWEHPENSFISSYRIWRSTRRASYLPTDFVAIETVSSDNGSLTEYNDYEVDNGVIYVYFITSIDYYGRESRNPVDDDFVDYRLSLATPRQSSNLSPPTNLTAVQNGFDIDLSWTPTGGQFDGYEIWRSIGNKYSFEKNVTLPPSDSSYTDTDALLETSDYYYLVRKFHNESDLFITESNVIVSGAIFLGKIITEEGSMEFVLDDVVNILNMEDPIRDITKEKLSEHKHTWNNDDDDRRINLGDTLGVIDWETVDYRTYITETDISDTTTYTVYLNGERTEILYTLDKTRGEISFEIRLARGDFDYGGQAVYPFEEPPSVEVIFDNLLETQQYLPKERIAEVSAIQVDAGEFESVQLPSFNHDGRIKERLLPIQIDLVSVDNGYRFTTVDKEENVGSATVFYDVILDDREDDNLLIASTSEGLLVSEDFGLTWQTKFVFPTPAIKLFYAPDLNVYFALTNRGVYMSKGVDSGGFSIWDEVAGTENTNIVRDIIETTNKQILCTSDLGVYRLHQDTLRNNFLWQQMPIFGPRSTETFAILSDEERGRVIISNELGIFETTNDGDSWSFSDDMPDQRIIYSFFKIGTSIFAVTKFMLWRLLSGESQFKRISSLDGHVLRKVLVWKDRIFIASSEGLFISKPNANIYQDNDIEFELGFPQINRRSYIVSPTSLNVIDDKLFIGTEQRLFISFRPGRISIQSEILNGVVPTIYIDGIEQKIGYRFTTDLSRRYVCFDEKQRIGTKITLANQYKKFKSVNGGWNDTDYKSAVTLYVDGLRVNDGSIAEKPFTALSQMTLPTYNDRNAHKAGADIAREEIIFKLTELLANEKDADNNIVLTGFSKENVVSSMYAIEKFLSQLYPETRVVIKTNEDGISEEVPFVIPPFRVLLLACSAPYKSAGISSYGKYRDFPTDGSPGSLNSESSVSESDDSSGGTGAGGDSTGSDTGGDTSGTDSTGSDSTGDSAGSDSRGKLTS